MTPHQQALRGAIVNHYLETGADSTVKELAALLRWSESKVRKHLNDARGNLSLPGIRQQEASRASHSKNYPAFEAGAHRVTEYGPSRSLLREMIVAAAKRDATASTIAPGAEG